MKKIKFLYTPTISTKKDMINLKLSLGKVCMKNDITLYFNKAFPYRYPINRFLQFKHYFKNLDICIKNFICSLSLINEPVNFQAKYERKIISLHIIIKI